MTVVAAKFFTTVSPCSVGQGVKTLLREGRNHGFNSRTEFSCLTAYFFYPFFAPHTRCYHGDFVPKPHPILENLKLFYRLKGDLSESR